MNNSSFKKYRVHLVVGRDGEKVEMIVSVWDEEDIEEAVEHLYGDKAHVVYYGEIDC